MVPEFNDNKVCCDWWSGTSHRGTIRLWANVSSPCRMEDQVPKFLEDQVPRFLEDQVPVFLEYQVPRFLELGTKSFGMRTTWECGRRAKPSC